MPTGSPLFGVENMGLKVIKSAPNFIASSISFSLCVLANLIKLCGVFFKFAIQI